MQQRAAHQRPFIHAKPQPLRQLQAHQRHRQLMLAHADAAVLDVRALGEKRRGGQYVRAMATEQGEVFGHGINSFRRILIYTQ